MVSSCYIYGPSIWLDRYKGVTKGWFSKIDVVLRYLPVLIAEHDVLEDSLPYPIWKLRVHGYVIWVVINTLAQSWST